MSSKTDIVNMALSLLKRNPIQDIDDSTIEANTAKLWYDPLRLQLLELYAWTFAIKRVQLQQTTAPAYQYAYAYQIPSDCVMELEARADIIQDSSSSGGPSMSFPADIGMPFTWLVEGDTIVTNADVVFLKYSWDVTQTGLYTPSFTLAFSYRIASVLCMPLTGDSKLSPVYMKLSDDEARRAQSRDAMKGTQEEFVQQDKWMKDRNSRYLRYSRDNGWQGATN